jgi:peptidyl-prolyl cis-trans isomerase D
MQHLMRKYKREILAVTIALIIVPFVLWGGCAGGFRSKLAADRPGTVGPVAMVNDVPIGPEQFRQMIEQERQARTRGEDAPTYKELAEEGVIEQVLDNMIKGALVELDVADSDLTFERGFLTEQLKKVPLFQNEKGEFDPELWNSWIDQNSNQNWNEVYESLTRQVRQDLWQKRILAPARATESELREEFEADYTKIKVKYAAIEPPIEPTEEQIQEQYEENKERYEKPAERVAEFVAVSLTPPPPDVLNDLVFRAREEDFAALANEFTDGADKENGGDAGWIVLDESVPPHQEVLRNLEVGQTSAAVPGPSGYYIYKVEEERISEETSLREVHVRQIFKRASLTEGERKEREGKAKAIAAKAQESGDLSAAAAEAGLSTSVTGSFSVKSTEIQSVPKSDTFTFRSAVSKVDKGKVSDPIPARENIYVAKVVEWTPAVPQPLEAVRDEVEKDAAQAVARSEEYQDKVDKLAREIVEKAESLGDIPNAFPELDVEINESDAFSVREFDYSSGLFWNPRDVYEAVKGLEPGQLGGPVRDFRNKVYFVELVELTLPDEKLWEEKWPEEKDRYRERMLAMRQQQRMEDYILYLYNTAPPGTVKKNAAAITELLGLDRERAEEEQEDQEAEAPAVDEQAPSP